MKNQSIVRPLACLLLSLPLAAVNCPKSNEPSTRAQPTGGTLPTAAAKYPNDPFYKYQWNLHAIDMPIAWGITTGSSEVVVAIGDAGIVTDLPDLGTNKYCADRYFPVTYLSTKITKPEHGTDVMRVAARCSNQSIGLSSVDWNATVVSLDATSGSGISGKKIQDFLTQSVKAEKSGGLHIHVVNFSFGSSPVYTGPFSKANAELSRTIELLNQNGTTVIASSGNDAINMSDKFPAAQPGIISVGATTKDNVAASFSNWGTKVAIMAPGDEIPIEAINPSGNPSFRTIGGTSFSAPHATGVAALIYAVNRHANWKIVEHLFKHAATPSSCKAYCSTEYDTLKKKGVRKQCQQDCCKKDPVTKAFLLDAPNICTSGLLNAGKAVEMATHGTPLVPLIDSDDYNVFFLNSELGTPKIIHIINRGGAIAHVLLVNSNPHGVHVNPEKFDVDPGAKVAVTVNILTSGETTRLEFRSQPFDENDPLSDSIVVYAGSAGPD